MGLFKSTPEEKAAKEAAKAAVERQRAEAAFAASPAGRARAAKAAGRKIFQIDIPLSETVGRTEALVRAYADTSATADASDVIQSIESQGWHLDQAGYVYRVTGSVSRDKLLSSGQQQAVHGEILGIYIFRAA